MKRIRNSLFPDYQCEEHGIYDLLPCPWPNCTNGLSENEFEVASLISDKEPDLYRRHEWSSSAGGKYYTWQKNNFPGWFSCKKTLWSEARRRKLITASPTKIVYHYTSIDGFMGILSSRSVWLSDYSYMNDRREIAHGADIVRGVAEEIRIKSNSSVIIELLESWINNLQDIKERVCIFSFSADGDSLSQLRAYGTIAIGFEVSKIAQHVSQVLIQPVEYSEEAQSKLAHLYLNHLCQSYLEDSSKYLLERIPDIYHKTNQLIELISFFKDSSFQDEREYRVVFIENKSVIESLGLKKPKKNFRSTNSHIIPYVSSSEIYPLAGNERPLEVAEIVLGPNSDEMLERGVRELLLEHGENDIPIRRSRVPYRT